ncbi:MAG: rhodanese-like domain-containing protein [Acidimicrobiales bacterium]
MGVPAISVSPVVALRATGAVLLDVHDLPVWRLGRIKGAIVISLGGFPDRAVELSAESIACIWRTKSRSLIATQFLVESGREVLNLRGRVVAKVFDGEPLVADHDHPSVG